MQIQSTVSTSSMFEQRFLGQVSINNTKRGYAYNQVPGNEKKDFPLLMISAGREARNIFFEQSELEKITNARGISIDELAETHLLPDSPEEAMEMTGEGGYWGIEKTAARLAEFVLSGAGDDLEKLKAGREGIIKGFQEAEKLWGTSLPEISYKTLEKSLSPIDERINELGGSIIDVQA
jgi:hypothetical protein